MAVGHLAYEWYPQIITPGASAPAIIAYAAYAALGAVPVYLQIKEDLLHFQLKLLLVLVHMNYFKTNMHKMRRVIMTGNLISKEKMLG